MSMLQGDPTTEFELLERVGQGSFGEVWKAIHVKTKKLLAIKKVNPGPALADMTKEIAIMKKCVSPHIVRYYGNYHKDGLLWIVMEYCSMGSVNDLMVVTGKTLNEVQVATMCKAFLEALHFMQTQSKIHRDIKPHNLLLNQQGFAKLCDFGISSDLESGGLRRTVIGTPYYLAPEVIKESGYDFKADIWSVGISAIEMAEKDPPYADLHPMRVLFVVANNPPPKLTHEEHWSPEFVNFVNSCLELNPEKRPGAAELLKHPFLAKANNTKMQPLIQAALDAIAKHGGLEKALDAMRPKPEQDEAQQDVDPDDLDDNMKFGSGSGALFTLDSPGSTVGTSLAFGSSDEDEGSNDFFDDFKSSNESSDDDDDSSSNSNDDLDIDDILADLGDDSKPPAKAKKSEVPVKKEKTTPTTPQKSSKPITSLDLNLDFTDILETKQSTTGSKLKDDDQIPTSAAPSSRKTIRTPRVRKDEGAKLKIQMGVNGQIFGAPKEGNTPLPSARYPISSRENSAVIPIIPAVEPEIDWERLEADAAMEAQLELELKQAEAEASQKPSIKNSAAIDWSKVMNEVRSGSSKLNRGPGQTTVVTLSSPATSSTPTRKNSSIGGMEDLLQQLDTLGRRSSSSDMLQLTQAASTTSLARKAFDREFPVATTAIVKGLWKGISGSVTNPFRNNPQFAVSITSPTQALFTLRQTSNKPYIPHVGFYVFQVRAIGHKFPELPNYGAICEAAPTAERVISVPALLDDADTKYVIVPIIKDLVDDEEQTFEFEIKYANEESAISIKEVPNLHSHVVHGAWTPETAGGCNHWPTWRQNPQYLLKVHKPTDMHMFLTQDTEHIEHVGCYIVRADEGKKVLRLPQSKLVNNDLKFRKKPEIYSGRLQLLPGNYVVIPATYEPGKCHPFTLTLLSSAKTYDFESIVVPFYKSLEGRWGPETSGGCMNNADWLKNPKYSLITTKPTYLTFVMGLRHDTVLEKSDDHPFLGFYLFKAPPSHASALTRKQLIARTKNFIDAREVVETIRLDPGSYILLPCTYKPGKLFNFTLQAHAEQEVQQFELIEESQTILDGQWAANTAGGSFSVPTWRLNPQYIMKAKVDQSVIVSLEQPKKGTVEDLPFIGFAIIKPNEPMSADGPKIFNMSPKDVVHLTQFSNVHRSSSSAIAVKAGEELVLLPMTFLPGIDTTFKLSVNSSNVTLTKIADQLYCKSVDGHWSKAKNTAGGCMNNRDTWLNNPKFRFAIKKPTKLKFILFQHPEPTSEASSSSAAAPPIAPGGFYIFRSTPGSTQLTRQDFIGKSDFAVTKEVRAEFDLETGIYMIILTKFEPGKEGKLTLHVFSPHSEFAIGTAPN